MLIEKFSIELCEQRYGPLPPALRIAGCTVVRREFPLTNEAQISLELPS